MPSEPTPPAEPVLEFDADRSPTEHESTTADARRVLRRFGDLDRYDALLVAALGAVFILLQLFYLRRAIPLLGGDQLDYFSIAGDLQDTKITHRHLRIGLTLPVRLLIALFGYSEIAYYAVPVLAGLLFLAATYALGAFLHSRTAGLVAAIAATFNAHVFWDSSHLLPDLLAAGLFTAGLATIIGVVGTTELRRWNPGLVVSGMLLGWAYLTREYLVAFLPLALVALWIAGRPRVRHVAQVAGGALSMLAAELVYGQVLFGDPFAHIRRVISFKGPSLSAAPASGAATVEGPSLLDAATVIPSGLVNGYPGGWVFAGAVGCIVLGGLVTLVLRHRGRAKVLLLPLAWILLTYGLLTVASWLTNPRGATVIDVRKIRYSFVLFPALAAGGAIGLLLPFSGVRTPRWVRGGASLALLAVTSFGAAVSLGSIDHSAVFVRNGGGAEYHQFRSWLATEGDDYDRIFVDTGHGRSLAYVLPTYASSPLGRELWPGTFEAVDVDNPVPADAVSGLIAAHVESTGFLAGREKLPPYLVDVPEDWTPVMVADNGLLAVFASAGVARSQTPVPLASAERDPVAGATPIGADGWELDIPDGERVILSYRTALELAGESAVSIDLIDDLVGEGSLDVVCGFTTFGELAFNVTQPPGDPASSEFFCDGPRFDEVKLYVEGPIAGTLTRVSATAAPSDGR